MKKGKLVVFQDGPMVIIHGGPGDSWAASGRTQIPGYMEMDESDQQYLHKALSTGDVIMYFIKEKKVIIHGKLFMVASPLLGRVLIGKEEEHRQNPWYLRQEHDPDDPESFQFFRPVLDGKIVCLPVEILPFVLEALSSIKAIDNL